MKSKAINAKLNERSKTFENWLKYEVTIQHVDGSTEVVPAYGKDLQDALSRVVHDENVKKIETKVIKKIPQNGWAIAWFLGLAFTTSMLYYNVPHRYAGYWIVGVLVLYAFATLSITNWFALRNKSK